MVVEPPPVERTPKPGKPFQFSVKALLILVTAVCVLLGLSLLIPAFVQLVGLLIFGIVVPAGIAAVAIFSEGNYRAFAVGAFVPLVFFSQASGPLRPDSVISLIGGFVGLLVLGGIGGATAVFVRRFVISKGWDRPD